MTPDLHQLARNIDIERHDSDECYYQPGPHWCELYFWKYSDSIMKLKFQFRPSSFTILCEYLNISYRPSCRWRKKSLEYVILETSVEHIRF